MSSRKFHAGNSRGEDGNASETRRCFRDEDALGESDSGNGAVNENVDDDGSLANSTGTGFSMMEYARESYNKGWRRHPVVTNLCLEIIGKRLRNMKSRRWAVVQISDTLRARSR